MPVAIWPIAYIDSYSEVWGGWRREVEGAGKKQSSTHEPVAPGSTSGATRLKRK